MTQREVGGRNRDCHPLEISVGLHYMSRNKEITQNKRSTTQTIYHFN